MFPLLTTFGITLPTFGDIASSSGQYAVGFFNEMSPVAWFIVGLLVAPIILTALIRWIGIAISMFDPRKKATAHLTESGNVDYHVD